MLENISDENYTIKQTDFFENNGLMYDGSQASSLLNVKTCKKLLLMLAAMGLNTFMLYTENTFELPDEPYWGICVPNTARRTLRIDDFAYSLGIEVIPCVQTLGHLSEAIKRQPYSDFSDTPSTLLVGDDHTYALCDKIIKTMSETFRSKRIHVGLDEAWGLGRGNYLAKNGLHSKLDIMLSHISRILEICKKYGYSPMMWGDMFVRVCVEKENNYLENTFFEFPDEIRKKIPKDMQIVYWDYYNRKEQYDKWISEYKKLSLLMQDYKAAYPDFSQMFEFYGKLADALSIKGDIGKRITEAYKKGDRSALKKIADGVLPALEQALERLRTAHQQDFYSLYKPIGREILDIRYGGAIMGVKTAKTRIDAYLNNEINRIEELEEPRLFFNGQKGLGSSMNYARICSASNL